MDLSFIVTPHEYSPRRVFSTTGSDWQERINWDRLRRDRLNRAKEQLEKHDLGALVLFVGENVRYVRPSGSARRRSPSSLIICYIIRKSTSSEAEE